MNEKLKTLTTHMLLSVRLCEQFREEKVGGEEMSVKEADSSIID